MRLPRGQMWDGNSSSGAPPGVAVKVIGKRCPQTRICILNLACFLDPKAHICHQ